MKNNTCNALFVCIAIMAMGHTHLSAQTLEDSITARFDLFERIPREKLYLHLDKPYYGAGEKLWYKGYLVDAMTHQDKSQSNFIITELINRSDSVVERRKVRRDSLGFAHAFTLPATLPAGDYYLRGYTNWMLNEDPAFLFSRNLKIGNSIDNTILSSIEYQQEDDTHYAAKVRFYAPPAKAYEQTSIRYRYLENGKVKNKGKRKTDENGWISIPLPDLKPTAKRIIEVEFDDPQYIYKKTFYVPVVSKEFDVTFFPEGGALVDVPRQAIAFKAQGADGYSKEIQGILFNAQGDTLTTFRSEHDGMGLFTLNATAADKFHVLITSADGVTKRFDLPAAATKGIQLSMTHYKKEIRYEIQKATQEEWPQKLFLLAHTRGKLRLLLPIHAERTVGKMQDSLLQAGITHFMLVDQSGRAVSERLLFIPDHNRPQWQVQADKESYGKREKVSLHITAKDRQGAPLAGTFSMSITDRRSVLSDSLADHICSNLLLTSDLKGHIENPGYYFARQDTRTLRALNLLMLTHGWRRHELKHVPEAPILNITHYIEKGQTISGRIKGFFGGNVKKGPIHVLAPKLNIFSTTTTDEQGEFVVNTEFSDSTTFIVQARTKRGFAGVDIEIDPLKFPDTFHKTPFSDEQPISFMDDYLANTRDQYYMEGGIRVYNLKEVVVTGNHRSKSNTGSIYTGGINAYTVEGERLEKMGGHTVLDAVKRMPSVSVTNGNEIHIRNHKDQPLIVVDDVAYNNTDIILAMPIEHVASISLLRGAGAAILGPGGDAGAIILTMKDPGNLPATPARGITTHSPLGYSDAIEFYHPTYDTPEKKNAQRSDARTTLYWNPHLQLDAEGQATVTYYTSDNTSPADVIIEGVDKQGNVHRTQHTVNRK